ncbi:ABC transporter ATP-binding protein [Thermodesulfobacteriota bacterium]
MRLEILKLTKTFHDPRRAESTAAIQETSFAVETGQLISLIGPSGCGKSTLLRIIAGLETLTSGSLNIDGGQLKQTRQEVGFVFQEYALFPWRTVRQNVEFGLETKGISRGVRKKKAREMLRRFDLSGFENSYPGELSGGMKQRVAIARTLIDDSKLILMDEPFGALDSQTRSHMQQFLLSVWQDMNPTIIFVTHNIDEAVYLSQRVLGMTKRPGCIGIDLAVDLPYPRDVTGNDFNEYRRQLLSFLQKQN